MKYTTITILSVITALAIVTTMTAPAFAEKDPIIHGQLTAIDWDLNEKERFHKFKLQFFSGIKQDDSNKIGFEDGGIILVTQRAAQFSPFLLEIDEDKTTFDIFPQVDNLRGILNVTATNDKYGLNIYAKGPITTSTDFKEDRIPVVNQHQSFTLKNGTATLTILETHQTFKFDFPVSTGNQLTFVGLFETLGWR